MFSQVESLEKSLDDLLTRVDEFVGMLDMVRVSGASVRFRSRCVFW